MIVKNKGSWCEKHNQYARTKFDCPYCELDELRELVAWMLECGKYGRWIFSAESGCVYSDAIDEINESYIAARKSVEEML